MPIFPSLLQRPARTFLLAAFSATLMPLSAHATAIQSTSAARQFATASIASDCPALCVEGRVRGSHWQSGAHLHFTVVGDQGRVLQQSDYALPVTSPKREATAGRQRYHACFAGIPLRAAALVQVDYVSSAHVDCERSTARP